MGVDSGLPDFRGNEGFWKAYPPFAKLGLGFSALANPRWFVDDPALAWGFYGHRLHLYRDTTPHAGFGWLAALGARLPGGLFAFTSNVDGQFQKAGLVDVVEAHGSIHHLQCVAGCAAPIWSAEGVEVQVSPETLRASEPFPCCPRCGALARPNILMFGDGAWRSERTDAQETRLGAWLERPSVRQAGKALVVIELGAGSAVPTVRRFSEAVARSLGGTLIRINPREPEVPLGAIGLSLGALDGLRAILMPSA
jgi:NAD-dependent SIR2 family protein deacetylase